MNDQQRTAQIYGQRLRRRAPAKPAPPAPELTPESCGWTKQAIGCYWNRGNYHVTTVQNGDGTLRHYEVSQYFPELGRVEVRARVQDWANVERIADRRVTPDRRRPR